MLKSFLVAVKKSKVHKKAVYTVNMTHYSTSKYPQLRLARRSQIEAFYKLYGSMKDRRPELDTKKSKNIDKKVSEFEKGLQRILKIGKKINKSNILDKATFLDKLDTIISFISSFDEVECLEFQSLKRMLSIMLKKAIDKIFGVLESLVSLFILNSYDYYTFLVFC